MTLYPRNCLFYHYFADPDSVSSPCIRRVVTFTSYLSLKAGLETWAAALEAYESEDFDQAIVEFEKTADAAKICWSSVSSWLL